MRHPFQTSDAWPKCRINKISSFLPETKEQKTATWRFTSSTHISAFVLVIPHQLKLVPEQTCTKLFPHLRQLELISTQSRSKSTAYGSISLHYPSNQHPSRSATKLNYERYRNKTPGDDGGGGWEAYDGGRKSTGRRHLHTEEWPS